MNIIRLVMNIINLVMCLMLTLMIVGWKWNFRETQQMILKSNKLIKMFFLQQFPSIRSSDLLILILLISTAFKTECLTLGAMRETMQKLVYMRFQKFPPLYFI